MSVPCFLLKNAQHSDCNLYRTCRNNGRDHPSGTSRRGWGGRNAGIPAAPARRRTLERRAGTPRTAATAPLPRLFHVPALVRVTQTTDLLRQFFPSAFRDLPRLGSRSGRLLQLFHGLRNAGGTTGLYNLILPLAPLPRARSPAGAAPIPGGTPTARTAPSRRPPDGTARPGSPAPAPAPAPLPRAGGAPAAARRTHLCLLHKERQRCSPAQPAVCKLPSAEL